MEKEEESVMHTTGLVRRLKSLFRMTSESIQRCRDYYRKAEAGLKEYTDWRMSDWVLAFMRWRRELGIKRFNQAAGEQSNLFQFITGMQEIKLNNCETKMRWKWERIQILIISPKETGQ